VADRRIVEKLRQNIEVWTELRRPGQWQVLVFQPSCACLVRLAMPAIPQRATEQQIKPGRHAAPDIDSKPFHHPVDICYPGVSDVVQGTH
jgi:hypothetical protein